MKSSPEASDFEKAEVDLSFDDLMGPEGVMAPEPDEIAPTADSYEESRYCLTDEGKRKVEKLLANQEYKPFVDGIRKVKSRFARYSLGANGCLWDSDTKSTLSIRRNNLDLRLF